MYISFAFSKVYLTLQSAHKQDSQLHWKCYLFTGKIFIATQLLALTVIIRARAEWSGGAMVLGNLPVPGRPTNLD